MTRVLRMRADGLYRVYGARAFAVYTPSGKTVRVKQGESVLVDAEVLAELLSQQAVYVRVRR